MSDLKTKIVNFFKEKNKKILSGIFSLIFLFTSFFVAEKTEVGNYIKNLIDINDKPIEKPKILETYTVNTYERCVDSSCTKAYYSAPRYSDSKGTLINETPSLMNSEFKPYEIIVKDDGIHNVKILDYNLTDVKIEISLENKESKEVPIKYYNLTDVNIEISLENKESKIVPIKYYEKMLVTEEKNVLEDDKLVKKNITELKDVEVVDKRKYVDLTKSDKKEDWYSLELGQELHVGENSTVVTLSSGNEEFGDGYISGSAPYVNYNYGGLQRFQVVESSSTDDKYGYLKFDLTGLINSSMEITSANLILDTQTNYLDSGESFYMCTRQIFNNYTIDGESWEVGTQTGSTALDGNINWNERPGATVLSSSCTNSVQVTYGDLSDYNFSITDFMNKLISLSETSLGIYIETSAGSGFPSSGDYISIYSSEDSGSEPYIEFEYVIVTNVYINETIFNETSIDSGDTVRLNYSIYADGLEIDQTWVSLLYPNETTINYTASQFIIPECTTNPDNGTCEDCGGETTCGDCSGCSWDSISGLTEYNYSSCTTGTDCLAHEVDVDIFPFGGTTTYRNSIYEIDYNDAYSDIQEDDTTYWDTYNPGYADEMVNYYTFTIDLEDTSINDITNITFYWLGYHSGSSSEDMKLYVMNQPHTYDSGWVTTANYNELSTTSISGTNSPQELTYTVTSNISDYINPSTGVITWVLAIQDDGYAFYVDYVEMLVRYGYDGCTGTPSCDNSTENACESCGVCTWGNWIDNAYTVVLNDTTQSGQYNISWIYANTTNGVLNSTYFEGLGFNVTSSGGRPALTVQSVCLSVPTANLIIFSTISSGSAPPIQASSKTYLSGEMTFFMVALPAAEKNASQHLRVTFF